MRTPFLPLVSHKEQEQQEAEGNEAAKYDPVPPLLCPYSPDETIDPWYLARCANDSPINVRQRLSLHTKLLIDRVGLTQHAICDIVTSIYSAPFVEHIIRLSVTRVGRAVCVDIRPDIREQVGSIPSFADAGA